MWTFWGATGISADGTTIVGSGIGCGSIIRPWIIHLDTMEPPAIGDLTCDDEVGPADLAVLLANWGPVSDFPGADFNGDRLVDVSDLADLLANWE
jgi:hypothetical protein